MEKEKLHIVLLPWSAFGHMIPYLELAKRLARMGHHVSFVSTPRNIDRLLPNMPHDLQSHLHFVRLTPPAIEGLPEDAQSTNDVPFHQIPLIIKLQDAMEGPVRAFIEDNPLPDWIIHDMFHYWAPAVATDFGIPSVLFSILTAMTHCFFGPPSALLESRDDPSPRQLTAPHGFHSLPTSDGNTTTPSDTRRLAAASLPLQAQPYIIGWARHRKAVVLLPCVAAPISSWCGFRSSLSSSRKPFSP